MFCLITLFFALFSIRIEVLEFSLKTDLDKAINCKKLFFDVLPNAKVGHILKKILWQSKVYSKIIFSNYSDYLNVEEIDSSWDRVKQILRNREEELQETFGKACDFQQ